MEINSASFTGSAGAAVGGSVDLASTFNNFLMLLTTQLQHQDPLSPLDTNQFTEQLVQFTNVEQAIRTNSKLDQLIALQGANQLTGALDYIGKTVEIDSVVLNLSDGAATMTYEMASNADETTIEIIDENGKTVRTLSGETAAGRHELVWDGKDDLGGDLPEGLYGFVVRAVDAEGGGIALRQGTVGRVTAIEVIGGEVALSMGPLQVSLGRVTAIRNDDGGATGPA
jgi:flagellar basal-body rod modification protein FlgD